MKIFCANSVRFIFFIILFLSSCLSIATASPYQVSPYRSAFGSIVGVSLGAYGLIKESEQSAPTVSDIENLNANDIPYLDRKLMGRWNVPSQKASDLLLYTSPVAVGSLFLAHKSDALVLGSLYVETLSLTFGGTYLAKGLVYRYRPFTYSDSAPLDKKLTMEATRSFFSGHTSFVTANLVFSTKVFLDYNPAYKNKQALWATALSTSLLTGVLRMTGGMHFFSDVMTGFVWGGAVGYLVPELSKRKRQSVSLMPYTTYQRRGVMFQYRFR